MGWAWIGLDRIGLDWVGFAGIGMDSIGFDWIRLGFLLDPIIPHARVFL